MRLRVFALLPVLVVGFNALSAEPIDLRVDRPASLVFLRMPYRDVAQEGPEASLTLSWANDTKLLRQDLLEDHETASFRFRYAEPLGPKGEWEIEVPLMIRGSGLLDSYIASWHELIGEPQVFADRRPLGGYLLRYPGAGPVDPATGLGDIRLGYGHRLDSRLAVRGALKLPTGNSGQLLGSGGLDAGVLLDYRTDPEDLWGAYVAAGLVAQSSASRLDNVRGLVHQAAVAVSYRPNGSETWLMQWNSEASPMITGNPASDSAHRLLTWAYRKEGRDGALEVWLSEDGDFRWVDFPGGPGFGPDVTLGLRLIRK
jgi:hypothetical protein